MEIQDLGVIFSFLASTASILLVLYFEIWRGPRLKTWIEQINLLRIPTHNKGAVFMETFIEDILSESASESAVKLVSQAPEIRKYIESKDEEKIRSSISEISRKRQLSYTPPNEILERQIEKKNFGTHFYLPIQIINNGNQVGFVASLHLVFKGINNRKEENRLFLFSALIEMDPEMILKRDLVLKDSERYKKVFSGITISPRSSAVVHPVFVPVHEIGSRAISTTNILPGKYRIRVIGLREQKMILKSNEMPLELKSANFLESFHGSESVIWTSTAINLEQIDELFFQDKAT